MKIVYKTVYLTIAYIMINSILIRINNICSIYYPEQAEL